MGPIGRRRYKAWLKTVVQKDALTREELNAVIRGQLLLPAREIDGPLLMECFDAIESPGAERLYAQEDINWRKLRETAASLKAAKAKPRIPSRRRVLALVLMGLVLLALAAAAMAALTSRLFSFPYAKNDPQSYVQDEAYALARQNLAAAAYPHVTITVQEAVYDGRELRVVYSVRDTSSSQPAGTDMDALFEAAALDGAGLICDWIVVNGQDVFLSGAGQEPGEAPGEMLFYLQALLSEQEVYPQGIFTVGLPLAQSSAGSTVPRELLFTLDAGKAKAHTRRATPAQLMIDGLVLSVAEAEFSPIAGAISLVVKDERIDPNTFQGVWAPFNGSEGDVRPWPITQVEQEAHIWGDAQLYTPDGKQTGLVSSASWAYTQAPGTLPVYLRVTPPKGEGWPENMLLAVPDENGQPDPVRRIPLRLE